MRNPQTIAGQLWLQQYFDGMRRFANSSLSDEEALQYAVRCLRYLLEREPAYARETRQFALQCAMGVWNAGFPHLVAELVNVGRDTEIMDSELTAQPAPTALLLLCLADCYLQEGERLEGLHVLDELDERLSSSAQAEVLLDWVRARAAVHRAELEELDREIDRAHQGFLNARQAARPLVENNEHRRALSDQWITQIFGPRDATIDTRMGPLERQGLLQIEQTYVGSLMGLLRTCSASDDELSAFVQEMRRAVQRCGLTESASPFLLAPVLERLPPEEATSFGRFLADAASKASDDLMARGLLPEGIDPALSEMVHRAMITSADKDDSLRRVWDIVVQVAVARAKERQGNFDDADDAYEEALSTAIESGLGLPAAWAAGALAAFKIRHASNQEEHISPHVRIFLIAFEGTIHGEPEVLQDVRYRALLDEPLAAVTRWELTRDASLDDWEHRRRISVLLDLLRRREPPSDLHLVDLPDSVRAPSHLNRGLDAISNTISRIVDGLAGTDEVVALISQSSPFEQLFLLIDGAGLTLHRAGPEFHRAVEAVEEAAELAVFQASAGLGSMSSDAVRDAGRLAYDALPEGVRLSFEKAEMLLISHDFQGGSGDTPFELFHDGEEWLLTSKVIARFTSLSHLARTLDTKLERPPKRRALVTAAPEAVPSQPLYTAVPESTAIRSSLAAAGFDAPEINDERLSARFFTDRLSYVDVLHIAAHGEARANTEYVILPDGQRFSVDDLLARRQRSMPMVYLNTCELGRTRYLGGGQAKGLAYTLSELGSPVVLANTTDVLDETSTAIATAFYEEAVEDMAVYSLLAARKGLVEQGVHPALVARVIYFGDPWYLLRGESTDEETFDPAADLLDAYFDVGSAGQEEAWVEAISVLESGYGNDRLQAAVALLQGLTEQQALPDGEMDARLAELERAIALADELRHPPAQAVLRLHRADLVAEEQGDARAREWLRDAVQHLDPLKDDSADWYRLLSSARGKLRRRELVDQGLEIRHHNPEGNRPDEFLDTALNAMFSAQQENEEEVGSVRLRPREDKLEDIAWNTVVIGYPNRFEDVAEASAFAALLTRKLISRGHLDKSAAPYAPAMFTGLLWFLWSAQNTSYLEPEVAEGQAGTVLAMVRDLEANWSPPSNSAWFELVRPFPEHVDEALTYLDQQPWGRQHQEIANKIPKLLEEAQEILGRVANEVPQALAGCAAFVTGTLAVMNTYSPLEGSDDMYESLTSAVWSLTHDNESRFMSYLWQGFEPIRNQELDELFRWRFEQRGDSGTASHPEA